MEIAANQKKLWDETKLDAGLNASLELQCRKTMEIRTKHVRAGFAAGLEGLKAMEIGAKQYDKEGVFFGPQNIRKSRRAKMGLPSSPGWCHSAEKQDTKQKTRSINRKETNPTTNKTHKAQTGIVKRAS